MHNALFVDLNHDATIIFHGVVKPYECTNKTVMKSNSNPTKTKAQLKLTEKNCIYSFVYFQYIYYQILITTDII